MLFSLFFISFCRIFFFQILLHSLALSIPPIHSFILYSAFLSIFCKKRSSSRNIKTDKVQYISIVKIFIEEQEAKEEERAGYDGWEVGNRVSAYKNYPFYKHAQ